MANANMNYTYSPGVAPALIEYYERTLLENMRGDMVHYTDAQKRNLPEHNGQMIQFRKFSPFPAITTPLAEGVTPDGQTLTETAMRAVIKPYGGYVAMTDEMQWKMLDNMHQETAKLLADQAADSLEAIAANAYSAGLNVQFAGANTARNTIAATDKLTYADIKKAVRTLKRNNVRPFGDGFYHAIVHPDVVHDLTSDSMWTDVRTYYDKEMVAKYELGTIYKVKFFESTYAKVFEDQTYLFGTTSSVTATAYDGTNFVLTFAASTFTPDVARELAGKMVYFSKTISGTETKYLACIERVDVDTQKVYLRYDPQPGTLTSATIALKPCGGGATPAGGSKGVPVYSTIVYGQNAFGTVELGGTGRNIETIIKEPGSSGTEDPLNQRGTIAWKVRGFCAVILQDDFLVRIESGATA